MTTLLVTIENVARRDPARIAAIDQGERVAYADLNSLVCRMAAWLRRRGLGPGDMIGLTVRDEFRHLATSLALMRLGCPQIALASHEPLAQRSALAALAGVLVVIGEKDADRIDGSALIMPEYEAVFSGAIADTPALPDIAADSAPVLLPSSGTTGRPKLIPLSGRQLFWQGTSDPAPASVRYSPLSNEFNNAKRHQFYTLACGQTVVLANGADRHRIHEVCRAFGVTRVNLSPYKAQGLHAELGRRAGAGSLWPEAARICILGAPASGLLRQRLGELTTGVFVVYGATECGSVTLAGPEEHARHPDSVGYPHPGVDIEVVDEAGVRLPPGKTGQVRIRHPGCATAYFNDEAATARAFRDGWFYPGDLASMAPDGMLVFAGRDDDMMMFDTINVFPVEIEGVAEGFPGVRECAAFPLRSSVYGHIPLLAVVAHAGLDAGALLAHCRERLGARAPRKIVLLDSLPRNPVGKVMRRELEAFAGGAS